MHLRHCHQPAGGRGGGRGEWGKAGFAPAGFEALMTAGYGDGIGGNDDSYEENYYDYYYLHYNSANSHGIIIFLIIIILISSLI